MALNPEVIGVERAPVRRTWTSDDSIRYALGVGAGLGDPGDELAFTTENSHGIVQQVLPTFATVQVPGRLSPEIGDFDLSAVVHAEESLTLHAALPVDGDITVRSRVAAIHDKGSAAVLVVEADLDDPAGTPLASVTSSLFVRGAGGFGGDRGPSAPPWPDPDRAPDHEVRLETRPEQPLLYRLSGDRTPLHSDPVFAEKAGFPRPIMHGLCTYGFTGRALLRTLCGGDPARLAAVSGRFSAPLFPGDSVVVSVWDDGDGTARFRTTRSDGTVVIDRGTAQYRRSA